MTTPLHFFISEVDGGLYDTRKANWSDKALRFPYNRQYSTINSLAELKATLRAGPYAWPGGYPLYFVTNDGAALSFDAVRKEWRNVVRDWNDRNSGWRIIGCEVNYDDDDLLCAHTGERIPSAYGDDDEDC